MKRFVIGGAIAVLALSSSVVVSGGAGAAATKTPAVKVILLAETKGESATAVPYYADGMGMAAEELGSKVELLAHRRTAHARTPRRPRCSRRSTRSRTRSSASRRARR